MKKTHPRSVVCGEVVDPQPAPAVWLCAGEAEFSAASPGLDRALATAAQQHRAATELMLNSELVSVSSAVTVW